MVAAGLLAVLLGATAFVAVPQHRRLTRGWDPAAYRALLRADLIRVIAASLTLVLAILLAAQSTGTAVRCGGPQQCEGLALVGVLSPTQRGGGETIVQQTGICARGQQRHDERQIP